MEVRIEKLPQKTFVGKSIRMSIVKNKTRDIWENFMKERAAITNNIGTDLYSIQIFDTFASIKTFTPQTEFTKWAAIEVSNPNTIPKGFALVTIEAGLYAVFIHKGLASEFQRTFQYIFSEWLPASIYELDHRPHFEILGSKYKNNDPSSEEEVWIPIKKKEPL